MKNVKVRDADASKRRILDAAEEEFGRQGFAGARLTAIGKRARVPTSLIHFHFEDKELLYREVMGRALQSVTHDVRALMEGPAGLFTGTGPIREEQFRMLGDALVSLTQRFFSKHGALLSVLRREADKKGRAAFEAEILPAFELVIAELGRLREAGIIAPDIDPRTLFLQVVSMTAYPVVEPLLVDMLYPVETRDLAFEDRLRAEIVTTALARMFAHRSAEAGLRSRSEERPRGRVAARAR
jgi:AcrR family transcriptional regulator